MDLSTAQTKLAEWLAADSALANGGISYSIGSRSLTRADGQEIRAQIAYWQRVVNGYTARAAGATDGTIRVAKWAG